MEIRTGDARRTASLSLGQVLDYVALLKVRLSLLVLVTVAVGYGLGSASAPDWSRLAWVLAWVGLVAGGAAALNQAIEHDIDRKMPRTRSRPVPSARISPAEAVVFGAGCSLTGLIGLWASVGGLAAALTAASLLLYVFVYTPLKTRTTLNTIVGAVPGALPPVIGWAAASGELGAGAYVLFAIVFVWQLVHFPAIAWMYRDEYKNAGVLMLSVVDTDDGQNTRRQIILFTVTLIQASLLPVMMGLAGEAYLISALLLGLGLSVPVIRMALRASYQSARQLFIASIVYLPCLLFMLALTWAA